MLFAINNAQPQNTKFQVNTLSKKVGNKIDATPEHHILNFHFDYLTPSLIYKIARDKSGVLVLLFIIQSVQSQVQVNVQYFFRQVVGNKIEATLKRYLSS